MSVSPEISLRFEMLKMDHIAALLPIEHEAYPDPWTQGMFRQEVENRNSYFFVGYIDQQIAGYAGFWLALDEIHVTKVTVAGAFRGLGLGRKLMEYLLDRASKLGATRARLEVREQNEIARGLYESMGFRAIGLRKGYYAKTNETAVVMAKDLAPPAMA